MMDSATAAMISEGRNLADRLNAHFATTTSNSPVLPRLQSNNGSFYNPFFREVFEKKNEIEQVWSLTPFFFSLLLSSKWSWIYRWAG